MFNTITMATIKSYTDLEQSKVLAEFLPLESADMVLPFNHTSSNEYIPSHVGTRSYIEVYNEMIKLPRMEKKDVCELIQPVWSFSTLFNMIPTAWMASLQRCSDGTFLVHLDDMEEYDCYADNPIDACVKMILKLHELNLL